MSMENFRFTSAGWLGTIARDFTFENVRKVTQGIANYIRKNDLSRKGVIVAYDHRFMSEDFAAECMRVLLGNGIHVWRAEKALPAPTVSYAVYKLQLGGGIMITANYGHAYRSGIKFIPEYAGPLQEDAMQKIAREMQKVQERGKVYQMDIEEARDFDLVHEIQIDREYINHLKRLVMPPLFRRREGVRPVRVVVDPLFGSGMGYVDRVLLDLGCDVKVINNYRDPLFGGMEPGPWDHNVTDLKRAVVSYQADLGVALDGDGGIFGVVDEKGQFVSANYAASMILVHMLKTRSLRGSICRSVATTHLLDSIARENGLPLIETAVGFRYVADAMRQRSCMLGVEENGGFTVMGHNSDKDGILACLLMTEARAAADKPLSVMLEDVFNEYGRVYNRRMDRPLDPEKRNSVLEKLKKWNPRTLAGHKIAKAENTENEPGKKLEFENGAWILIRAANIAEKLRIYIESPNREFLEEVENDLMQEPENLLAGNFHRKD